MNKLRQTRIVEEGDVKKKEVYCVLCEHTFSGKGAGHAFSGHFKKGKRAHHLHLKTICDDLYEEYATHRKTKYAEHSSLLAQAAEAEQEEQAAADELSQPKDPLLQVEEEEENFISAQNSPRPNMQKKMDIAHDIIDVDKITSPLTDPETGGAIGEAGGAVPESWEEHATNLENNDSDLAQEEKLLIQKSQDQANQTRKDAEEKRSSRYGGSSETFYGRLGEGGTGSC